jgi:hypothetical protein
LKDRIVLVAVVTIVLQRYVIEERIRRRTIETVCVFSVVHVGIKDAVEFPNVSSPSGVIHEPGD